jgi:hypothetical protein
MKKGKRLAVTQLSLFGLPERVVECTACRRPTVIYRPTKYGHESEVKDTQGRCRECNERARNR